MNKYLLLGLVSYAGFELFRGLIYNPMLFLMRVMYRNAKPIDKISITYGKGTVIIAGATRGLGPAYCKVLIEAGFNDFVIIDDQEDEVNQLIQMMKDFILKSKREDKHLDITPYIIPDFNISYDQKEKFQNIEAITNKISKEKEHISVLINNIGILQEGRIENWDCKFLQSMINVNICAGTLLTRLIIPKMLSSQIKSAIVKVGSATAASPFFYRGFDYEIYQAAMSYQLQLNTLLNAKYPSIDFICDSSANFDIFKKNEQQLGLKVTPERHVGQVLKSLGQISECHGTVRHSILISLINNLPFIQAPL